MSRVSAALGAGGAAGQVRSGQNTHPTVTFLMLLVLLEFSALLGLRFLFKNVHGG